MSEMTAKGAFEYIKVLFLTEKERKLNWVEKLF